MRAELSKRMLDIFSFVSKLWEVPLDLISAAQVTKVLPIYWRCMSRAFKNSHLVQDSHLGKDTVEKLILECGVVWVALFVVDVHP